MRRFILAAFALLGVAVTAGAACVDTLYLTDLTVLHMSVVNSKVRGNWDTTSFDPWNEGALKMASPVDLGDHEYIYLPHSRNVTHPRTIYYKCDADSHSVIEYVTVSDSFFADTRNNAKTTSLATSTSVLSLALSKTTGFVFNGVTKSFAMLYLDKKNQTFSVGRRLATDSLRSWSSYPMAFYFDSSSVPQVLNNVGGYLPGALEDYALSTPDNALSALGPFVDKISAGTVDSTRMETKVFRYTYSYSKPVTAIRSLVANQRRLSARAIAQGVEIQLDRQAQVSIFGLNGSVAKSFSASSGPTLWDGRDAFGRKLSGIWIVKVEGLVAVPVLVR